MREFLGRFPATLSAPGAGRYTLDPDRMALRGDVPPALTDRVEDRLEEEATAIVRTPSSSTDIPSDADALPVYVLGAGATAFVPTGRATVRFRAGDDAHAHAAVLRAEGYRITDVPPYAPHLAWVENEAGDVASALSGLERLASLPGVEHVEPQMLSCGGRR